MNKVNKNKVEFIEEVKDFVGLVFHCPKCNCEMHLHIAEIDFRPTKIEDDKK
jgi:bacterioferritin-associated ferredoxin